MAKKSKKEGALEELLAATTPKVLTDLILELAAEWPDVRRECFDFLKTHVSVSKALEKRSEGEIVLALWSELAPDLDDLDSYGGGDYATEDHVAELLDQIRTRLDSKKVGSDHRRQILDRVLPYIESGNAGMDDVLYEVAYAACYDDADLRGLLARLEGIEGPLVVIGDFNVTDQQSLYAPLTRRLRDAHRESGWGMGFTFSHRPDVGLALWRIDYVFYSPELVALSAKVGDYAGSDHRPVIARLAFRARE